MKTEFKPMYILVVEDNQGDFVLLDEYLKISGLPPGKVFHAPSMAAAKKLIHENKFDIALLDLSLPDSFGLESVISLNKEIPHTAIVVFSGLADVEIAVETIGLGAQDYLVKGEFDEKMLEKTLQYSIERKKMLEKVKLSNERYEFVNKATLDTIWEWWFDTNVGQWGEGIINTFGYTHDQLMYSDDWMNKYLHPEDRERVNSRLKEHIECGHQHWQDEFRLLCANGSYKYVYDRGYILYTETGDPYRMIGAMTDITEKIKLEKELSQKELAQQKLITEATIQAQEKERNHLGKELHDNINQVLATIKMFLGLAVDEEEMRLELIQKSSRNVGYAMEEIRKLSKTLVAPSLGDIGLKEALEILVEEINISKTPKVELVIPASIQNQLDKNMELMIYRIVQEQLNNIRKYAKANRATITLKTENGNLSLSISDNGSGFDTNMKTKGIGLKNISSRVDFYAGEMKIISAPGEGCDLEISIPLL